MSSPGEWGKKMRESTGVELQEAILRGREVIATIETGKKEPRGKEKKK